MMPPKGPSPWVPWGFQESSASKQGYGLHAGPVDLHGHGPLQEVHGNDQFFPPLLDFQEEALAPLQGSFHHTDQLPFLQVRKGRDRRFSIQNGLDGFNVMKDSTRPLRESIEELNQGKRLWKLFIINM